MQPYEGISISMTKLQEIACQDPHGTRCFPSCLARHWTSKISFESGWAPRLDRFLCNRIKA